MGNQKDFGALRIELLRDDLCVTTLKKGHDVKPQDGGRLLEWLRELGKTKMKSLIVVEPGCTIDPELRNYMGSGNRMDLIAADAIVVNNFAHKLIIDFYFKYHRPNMNSKAFRSKEEALKWLEAVEIT